MPVLSDLAQTPVNPDPRNSAAPFYRTPLLQALGRATSILCASRLPLPHSLGQHLVSLLQKDGVCRG